MKMVSFVMFLGLSLMVGASDNSLVGDWRFDEESGTIAKDSSQYKNNGEINGAVYAQENGKTAVKFDGKKGNVIVPEAECLNMTKSLSLEMWVCLKKIPGENEMYSFIRKGSQYSKRLFWLMLKGPTKWQKYPRWHFEVGNGKSIDSIESAEVVGDEWLHIVCVFDNGNISLYINGNKARKKSSVENIVYPQGKENQLYFGATPDKYTPASLISEIKIYNRALTDKEIREKSATSSAPVRKELIEFRSNLTGGEGNWEDSKTWKPQGVPSVIDYVIIANGDKVTINQNAKIKDIMIEKGSQLIIDAVKNKRSIFLNLGEFDDKSQGALICKGSEDYGINLAGILPQGKVDAEVTDQRGWKAFGSIIADYTVFNDCDGLRVEKLDIDNCKFFNSAEIRINKNFVSFSNNELNGNGLSLGSKEECSFPFDNINILNPTLNDVKTRGKGIAEFYNSSFNIDNSSGNIISRNHNKIPDNYTIMAETFSLSSLKNKPAGSDNVHLLTGTFTVDENINCNNLNIDFGSNLIISEGKTLTVNGRIREEGKITGNIVIKNETAKDDIKNAQQVPVFSIKKTMDMEVKKIAVLDTQKYILDSFLPSFYISYDVLSNLDNINCEKYPLLILGLGEVKNNSNEFIKNKENLLKFVNDGGIILAFQQNAENWTDTWLPYHLAIAEYCPKAAKMSDKNHPIFQDVESCDLSGWKNAVAWNGITAADSNWKILANDLLKPEYATAVECKYGKGKILINNFAFQFDVENLHQKPDIKQAKLFSNILRYTLVASFLPVPFEAKKTLINAEELNARLKRIKCVSAAFEKLLQEMEPPLECLSFDLKEYKENGITVDTLVNEVSKLQKKLNDLGTSIDTWKKSENVELKKAKEYIAAIDKLNNELKIKTEELNRKTALVKPVKTLAPLKDRNDWINNTFHMVQTDYQGTPDCGSIELQYRYFKRLHTTFAWNPTLTGKYFQGHVPGMTQEEYAKKIQNAANANNTAIYFDITPYAKNNSDYCNDKKRGISRSSCCWNNPTLISSTKARIKKTIELNKDGRMHLGIGFDEIGFRGGYCDICKKKFREYLKNKYSRQELERLGITDIEHVLPPLPSEKEEKKVLWMEHREFVAYSFENTVKDLLDYAYSLDKKVFTYINESLAQHNSEPFKASLARLSSISDIFGIDPYRKADLIQAFMLDLIRPNSKGPTIQFTGAYEDPTKDVYERDLTIGMVHSQGIAVFDFPSIWKYKSPGKWNVSIKTFDKAKRVEDYLINTKSPSKIALLYSERSHTLDFSRPLEWGAPKARYLMLQFGIYTALTQAHIQTDPIFAEGMTEEKLSKYKVLIAADAKTLTKDEKSIIRNWVNNGGTLISFGSSTLFDRWGRRLNDYAFADIFGVSYQKTVNDETVSSIKINKEAPCLGNLAVDDELFFDDNYGHDIVKATTAETIALFADGAPGILINKYGKGKAVFIAASSPGLLQKGKTEHIFDQEHFSTYSKFLSELLKGVISADGGKLPFNVENAPKNVEVTMRMQAQKNRYILHFLNYGYQVPVKGIKVTLNLSKKTDKSKLNVFYADGRKKIPFSISKDSVTFPVDNFDVHQMIVIKEEIQ